MKPFGETEVRHSVGALLGSTGRPSMWWLARATHCVVDASLQGTSYEGRGQAPVEPSDLQQTRYRQFVMTVSPASRGTVSGLLAT